ncbi:hypothetical protein EGW08_010566 [Elysia chlorotica]|uniref:THAP-type domain-containing protein n=1 Tax=Elysia chlorotica TaxID=188477 RepID=A0A433TJ97_ELYCH|nr:hypothetical protein EGW08_010566 [Elysia chlorotica]
METECVDGERICRWRKNMWINIGGSVKTTHASDRQGGGHARHRCSALGCTSAPPSTDAFGRPIDDSDISFHKIPYDLPTFKKWVKAIGRTDIEPSPKWNLCSRHFTPDCFELFEKRLKPSSIPTLFWPPPPELLHCVDPKAPYLQPRIVLRRVDEPECEPRSGPGPDDSAKPNFGLGTEEEPMDVADVLPETVTVDLDMDATRHDHGYIKLETVDPEEEVARLRMLLEQLKEKVMSSSQRVKSLKISGAPSRMSYRDTAWDARTPDRVSLPSHYTRTDSHRLSQ